MMAELSHLLNPVIVVIASRALNFLDAIEMMLGIVTHRRKEMTNTKILAPLAGKLIPLIEVDDPIFSKKTMGEGFLG